MLDYFVNSNRPGPVPLFLLGKWQMTQFLPTMSLMGWGDLLDLGKGVSGKN